MELLCNSSEYFRGAFKGGFREAEDRTTTVDTNVNTMQIFMGWLYSQRLESPEPTMERFPEWYLHRTHLLNLYVLADRYDFPELRNEVMRIIEVQYGLSGVNKLPVSFTTLAFEMLPASSCLCRWLIQYFAHFWNPEQDNEQDNETDSADYDNLPRAFLLGVALACRKRFVRFREQSIIKSNTAGAEFQDDACFFHEHKDDESHTLCVDESARLADLRSKYRADKTRTKLPAGSR